MKPLDELSGPEFERLLRDAVQLPDAPPPLVRTAIGLFAARADAPSPLRTALRRIAAVLSFDSWAAAPLAAGMRALRSPTRHLLFSADGRDIDLRIAAAAPHFVLTGQVLGPDEAGEVELQPLAAEDAPDGPALACTLDALGEFRLADVPAGRYRLTLRLGDDEIVLPPVEIGEPVP